MDAGVPDEWRSTVKELLQIDDKHVKKNMYKLMRCELISEIKTMRDLKCMLNKPDVSDVRYMYEKCLRKEWLECAKWINKRYDNEIIMRTMCMNASFEFIRRHWDVSKLAQNVQNTILNFYDGDIKQIEALKKDELNDHIEFYLYAACGGRKKESIKYLLDNIYNDTYLNSKVIEIIRGKFDNAFNEIIEDVYMKNRNAEI